MIRTYKMFLVSEPVHPIGYLPINSSYYFTEYPGAKENRSNTF